MSATPDTPAEGPIHPDPSQIQTREELGAALAAQRSEAGLSIRQVVRMVPGLTLGTASGWFSGRHVPTLAATEVFNALLIVLKVDDAQGEKWRAAVERVRAQPGPRPGAPRPPQSAPKSEGTAETPGGSATPVAQPDTTGSPYVGLRPYGPEDCSIFYGRRAEVVTALNRLHSPRDSILLIVGASGSGKSSLVAAGIGPDLKEQGHAVTILRPTALAEYLRTVRDSSTVSPPSGDEQAAPVLVVDQLEELWGQEFSREERADLLHRVEALISGGTLVLATLRADFFQSALAEPALRRALDDEPLVLGPPDRDTLSEVIVAPARDQGYTVEPSLVTLLLDAVAPDTASNEEQSVLPLLSHVLLLCWERSRRRRITVDDYYSTGGVQAAIRHSAEAIYIGLDIDDRHIAHDLFLHLVDVRSAQQVRRRAQLADLDPKHLSVARQFASAGILSIDDTSVTPTHEVILSAWPRLVEWIHADHDSLRTLARVRAGALEWSENRRSSAHLPSASATADLQRWREELASEEESRLTATENSFIDTAAEHHGRIERRDRNRIRVLTGLAAALAVVTLIALVSSAHAFKTSSKARNDRDVALSRSGSGAATAAFARDPALGRSIALASYRINPTLEARSALLTSSRSEIPLRFPTSLGSGRAQPIPKSDTFATVSSDGALRVFSPENTEPLATVDLGSGERKELYDLAFSPDGTLAAVAGQGGVFLMDFRDPRQPKSVGRLDSEARRFQSARFSPDGSTLAAGASDGTVIRWEVGTRDGRSAVVNGIGRPVSPEPGDSNPKPVESLAWLRDSQTLLATNSTLGVKVLLNASARTTARRGPSIDTGNLAIPVTVAVSPDGRRIAAGTTNREVRRWELSNGLLESIAPLPSLGGWGAYVSDVSYDDSGRLTAAGTDEKVRIYDPAGTQLLQIPASQVAVSARFFGPDRLLTYAVDGMARVWSLQRLRTVVEKNSIFQSASSADRTRTVLGNTASELHYTVADTSGVSPVEIGRVTPNPGTRFSGSVAMSSDGRYVYAGLSTAGIQVFEAPFTPGARAVGALNATSGVIVATALSPDGRTLAVCSDTTPEISLLDVTTPSAPRLRIRVPLPDPCVMAEFSSDSRQLVVPTIGSTTLLFDTTVPDSPTEAYRLETGIGTSPSAGFAPDGPLLATSGGDKTIRLWDVSEPDNPKELSSTPSPNGEVYWTAFATDSSRLLISSSTGQVTVLDVSDRSIPRTWAIVGATTDPLLYQSRVASPTGSVLSVGAEGTISMWQLDVDQVVDEACSGGIQLTDEEWQRYFPDTERPQLCP